MLRAIALRAVAVSIVIGSLTAAPLMLLPGSSVTDPHVGSGISPLADPGSTHLTTPSHPENLTADAGPGAGEITLEWDPPHDDGGAPIDHYEVYRDGVIIANTTSTEYLDAGLGNNETHHYAVAAVNEDGESSEPCGIETATTFDVPSAPRNLTATAGIGRIDLSWDPPVDDGGTDVTGYRVYRNGTFLATTDVTGYSDTEVGDGVTRSYRVSAVNIVGEGPLSDPAEATTPDVPSAPRNLTATAGPGSGEITLQWEPPADDGGDPVTGYRLYRNGTLVAEPTTTTYLDRGLEDDTLYVYRVSAVNDVGEGPKSPSASAETFSVPSRVWWIRAAPGPERGEITVVWARPRDSGGLAVDHYQVHRDGEFLTNTTSTRLIDSGLGDGAHHVYRVFAVNPVGESDPSPRAAATTWDLPSAPQNVEAQAVLPTRSSPASVAEIELEWAPPAEDGGRRITSYVIFRGTDPGNLTFVDEVDGDRTRYRDEHLDPLQTYFYEVVAVNALGRGPPSEQACSAPFPWIGPTSPPTGASCEV